MHAAQVIAKEMMSIYRTDAERKSLRQVYANMRKGTMKPERLKIILTSLGYVETQPGSWELYNHELKGSEEKS